MKITVEITEKEIKEIKEITLKANQLFIIILLFMRM